MPEANSCTLDAPRATPRRCLIICHITAEALGTIHDTRIKHQQRRVWQSENRSAMDAKKWLKGLSKAFACDQSIYITRHSTEVSFDVLLNSCAVDEAAKNQSREPRRERFVVNWTKQP